MAWLVSDARVLASADVAATRAARRRGLLGRTSMEGALVIVPCRWIHTVGMRFPIDVAYLDHDGVVMKTLQMPRHRLGIPVWRAHCVIEAEAGAFSRWGLRVGDQIEIRAADEPGSGEPGGDGTGPVTAGPRDAARDAESERPAAERPVRTPGAGGCDGA
jgi:uncharacterized protein